MAACRRRTDAHVAELECRPRRVAAQRLLDVEHAAGVGGLAAGELVALELQCEAVATNLQLLGGGVAQKRLGVGEVVGGSDRLGPQAFRGDVQRQPVWSEFEARGPRCGLRQARSCRLEDCPGLRIWTCGGAWGG